MTTHKINFSTLLQSRFYHLGLHSVDSNNVHSLRKISCFDAHCFPNKYSIKDLFLKNYSSSDGYIGVSLARALTPSIDQHLKNEIVEQWAQTLDIVNQIPVEPSNVHFAMQPPGVPLHKHVHSRECKQTVTFCFTFYNNAVTGSEPSRFIISKQDKDYNFYYPQGHFYYTFKDNPPHQSISNEWRFFWIHDFDQYVTVPANDFQKMEIEYNN